jgi:hypothetical protein
LGLERKSIRDADLARLNGLAHFSILYLNITSVSDAGIANLGDLPKLQKVYLRGTQITDVGVERLTRYEGMRVFHAGETRITDRGVAALVKWPQLEELRLDGDPPQPPGITDAAIDTLVQLKNLRAVYLERTRITREGIQRLHAALPECRIESSHGRFGPEEK